MCIVAESRANRSHQVCQGPSTLQGTLGRWQPHAGCRRGTSKAVEAPGSRHLLRAPSFASARGADSGGGAQAPASETLFVQMLSPRFGKEAPAVLEVVLVLHVGLLALMERVPACILRLQRLHFEELEYLVEVQTTRQLGWVVSVGPPEIMEAALGRARNEPIHDFVVVDHPDMRMIQETCSCILHDALVHRLEIRLRPLLVVPWSNQWRGPEEDSALVE